MADEKKPPFNESAFPHLGSVDWHSGMTLRDYFAAHLLGGWLGSSHPDAPFPAAEHFPGLAKKAYALADAMLAEREATHG